MEFFFFFFLHLVTDQVFEGLKKTIATYIHTSKLLYKSTGTYMRHSWWWSGAETEWGDEGSQETQQKKMAKQMRVTQSEEMPPIGPRYEVVDKAAPDVTYTRQQAHKP
jgi:hypothetical protein